MRALVRSWGGAIEVLNAANGAGQIPASLWVVIGVVLLFTVVIDVLALVDLYRRPVERVTGRRKWIWALVILLVNSGLGAIIYFLAGRQPAPAVDTAPSAPAAERSESAMDALYGAPKEDGRP
jgi:drug/metabolite transporter (DMT)-like permease